MFGGLQVLRPKNGVTRGWRQGACGSFLVFERGFRPPTLVVSLCPRVVVRLVLTPFGGLMVRLSEDFNGIGLALTGLDRGLSVERSRKEGFPWRPTIEAAV